MVERLAVGDGVRAGRVVAAHPADGRPVRGGRVGAEEEPQRPDVGVQLVLDEAGLDAAPALLLVHLEDPVHELREVHDHRVVHRLAGEARAAAPWEHGDVVAVGQLEDGPDVGR